MCAKKYFPQETYFTCGAASLRNCLIELGHRGYTEKTLRRKLNTTKENGTETWDLIKGIGDIGFKCRGWKTKSRERFIRIINKGLFRKNVFIVLQDATTHWVSVLRKEGRLIVVADPEFPKPIKMLTQKEFLLLTENTDKIQLKKYFFAIEIHNTKDKL